MVEKRKVTGIIFFVSIQRGAVSGLRTADSRLCCPPPLRSSLAACDVKASATPQEGRPALNSYILGNRINIQEIIEKARKQLAHEPNLSPALKTTIDLLINLCLLLAQKGIPKNSSNSSIPPSADPNRKKTSRAEGKRKPGGQAGHPGATLKPVDTPDKTVPLTIDRRTLPAGEWKAAGWEKRQVIEMEVRRVVTEYRAELLEDKHEVGKEHTVGIEGNNCRLRHRIRRVFRRTCCFSKRLFNHWKAFDMAFFYINYGFV